ncbi:MAG: hypothetical protein DSY99_04430, partial [Candidatus Neomarinimicrobiota bacterium]
DADFYSLTPSFTSSSNAYVDSSANDATTYYYRVGAADAEGDESIMAFARHGRLGNDSTSIHLQGAHLTQTLSSDLDSGANYTIEAFVRFPEFPSIAVPFILIGDESVSIAPSGDDGLIKMNVDGVAYDGDVISDSAWHHLALTTDGSSTTLWIDGHSAVTAVGSFDVNGSLLQFGDSASTALPINIDAARLSSIVRYTNTFISISDLEIDANTLGHWKFNEGSSDDQTPFTYDRSGLGFHFMLENNYSWSMGIPETNEVGSALVINEIMQNPSSVSDPLGEWIEIHNRWFTPVHLKDFILADDGTDGHTIAVDIEIPLDGYAVLGINADTSTNGGVEIDYIFSEFSLANSFDEVVLKLPDGTELDRVNYDNGATFPDPTGASMELIAPHYDNSIGSNWATALIPYGEGDLGSPGRRNDAFSGQVAISDSLFNFGGIVEGSNNSATLTIFNQGVRHLNIDSITVTLPEYTLSTSSAIIEIGDSNNVVITFAPNAAGVYEDDLKIYSDDPTNEMVTVSLYAIGISALPDIVVMIADDDSLSAYSFPFTRIGTPRTFTMNVINIGAADLEIDEFNFSGDDDVFSVDVSSLDLLLNDTVAVNVTFDPDTTGTFNTTLSLTSNDPDESIYNIDLDGIGTEYTIFYVPDEIATIQTALDSTLEGDTINVAPGIYIETLTFPDNDLVLRGAGAESTILTGGDSSVVFTLGGGQTNATIISGFTIQNGSGTNGGGMLLDNGSSPTLKQLIFKDNTAAQGAAIYANGFSSPTVVRSTFVVNSASSAQGAGIAIAGGSNVTINNSIFWANNGTAVEVLSGSSNITYSIVEGGAAGTGNIDQDPIFVNPGTGDFHLQWASAAIDAGDPAAGTDLDGTVADMGVFPYDQSQQPPDSPYNVAAVPGNGQATISWSAPVDPRGNENGDIVSYVLYHGLTAESLTVRDTLAVTDTSYIDAGTEEYLQNGTTYYYAVTAIDTGALVSAASVTVSVIPAGGTLVLADTTHAFGQVFHDNTAAWNLVLTNSGNDVLNISSITTATELFTLSQQSVQIAAGEAETIQVTYHPDLTSGTVNDTLSITSDDLYLPSSNVTLSAESIWPVISLSTTAADYGDVPVITDSSLGVVVYNTGLGDLTLSSPYVDDTDHFTVNTGGRMLPGSSISNAKIIHALPVIGGRSVAIQTSKEETGLADTWET